MNRKQRRQMDKIQKQQEKQKYTLGDIQKAMAIAMQMKKESRGHLFKKHLKERCVFCGKTRRVKTTCDFEWLTFLDRMQTVLVNKDFFRESEVEAIYLQHGDEYKDIKVLSKDSL